MSKGKVRLVAIAAAHAIVDGFATMPTALVALYFLRRHDLSKGSATAVLSVMAASTSLLQPVWGYLGERFDTRRLFAWMPLGAALAMIGAILTPAGSWGVVLLLAGVSGVFVAAFHPEAARAAGQSWPARRSLAMAVFLIGGTLGMSSGPVAIGCILDRLDPRWVLVLLAPPVAAGMFLAALGCPDYRRNGHGLIRFNLGEALRGRKRIMLLLLVIATTRNFVIGGVLAAMPFLIAQRPGATQAETGGWVAVFVLAGGLGMLASTGWVRPDNERAMMALTMLGAIPLLMLYPYLWGWPAVVVLAVAGALTFSAMPVTVAMGQRIVPAGMGLASSVLIGLSWGIGGSIAPRVAACFEEMRAAIWCFAAVLVVPAALSMILPGVVTREPDRVGEPA